MTDTTAPQDPRPTLESAMAQAESVLAAIRPEDWTRPTPCGELDVAQLASHLLAGTQDFAKLAGNGVKTASSFGEPTEDPEQLAAAYAEAAGQVRAAWADDALLDRRYQVPWGHIPGRGVLSGATMEAVTHAWDLAEATDWSARTGRSLDPELAEAALAEAHRTVGAERRGEGVPFGPVQPVPADADAYRQLAAWLGRTVS